MAQMFYFIERGSLSIHKWKVLNLAGFVSVTPHIWVKGPMSSIPPRKCFITAPEK